MCEPLLFDRLFCDMGIGDFIASATTALAVFDFAALGVHVLSGGFEWGELILLNNMEDYSLFAIDVFLISWLILLTVSTMSVSDIFLYFDVLS